MPSAKVPIYAYDLLNPTKTASIEIEMTNTMGHFYFEDEDTGEFKDTTITLYIPDTKELGFIRGRLDEKTQQCLYDLLTAINLNLEESAMTKSMGFIESADFEYTDEELEAMEESYFGDLGLRVTDSIDETEVLKTYEDLRKFNRYSYSNQSSKEKINVIKALELYDNALSSVHKYTQHMLLYMALEHAVLYKESSKVQGTDLDEKMGKVTSINKSQFKNTIRTLYNRQKHPDRNQKDVKKSLRILENDKELYTHSLNRVLSQAIINRVQSLIS